MLNFCIEVKSAEQVTKTKLLGVKLDYLLSRADHIDYIVSIMGKRISISW